MNKTILNNIDQQMSTEEKLEFLFGSIARLQSELDKLQNSQTQGWMSLDQAAQMLGKTASAVRQRLKSKTRPMPQGKVWKQQDKGFEISVHLTNYRKYM